MRSATKKKIGKSPLYLAFIRAQPCCVCASLLLSRQWLPTEAAHIGPRGLSTKVPDRQAIPLCKRHHEESHKGPKKFWMSYMLDPEQLIAEFNARFEAGERA
jgi:hypothetical protein